MTHLVVGCGYLGLRVACAWRDEGHNVFVTTRSHECAEQLMREGFPTLVLDVTLRTTLDPLPPVRTVCYAIGYDRRSGSPRAAVSVDGLRAVLDRLPRNLDRLIYVSSTGVYGHGALDWVDEQTPCEPTREAGRLQLAAERLLAEHPLGACAIVLRLAGLYGPGRIPLLADLRAGSPIPTVKEGWVNLIHVDDAVRVVLATQRAEPPRTYLVSDGQPVLRRQFYRDLARLLNAPSPRFFDIEPSDRVESRGGGRKRVRNERIRAELKIDLAYPSYREGLRTILAEGGQNDSTDPAATT